VAVLNLIIQGVRRVLRKISVSVGFAGQRADFLRCRYGSAVRPATIATSVVDNSEYRVD
jgi:hypothetical protein